MISEERKREVVAAFQRSFKHDNSPEIEGVSLQELRAADEMLGDRDRNAGFRLRMRNRIAELEEQKRTTPKRGLAERVARMSDSQLDKELESSAYNDIGRHYILSEKLRRAIGKTAMPRWVLWGGLAVAIITMIFAGVAAWPVVERWLK